MDPANESSDRERLTRLWLEAEAIVQAYVFAAVRDIHDAEEVVQQVALVVKAMDKNVATMLAELDRLGLRHNTIVVFTSDNSATEEGSNLPFRGGKHTVFEGGTRLPTVIH